MPTTPRRPSRRRSPLNRWDERISLVYCALVAGFAIVISVAVLFNLPSNPDKWWITSTAQGLIETGMPPTLASLLILAIYSPDPEIRHFVARFRALRMMRLAIAILLPSGIAAFADGITLLQDPARWSRLILALLFAAIAVSATLLAIALIVGYAERKRLPQD
jgi:hypothetical protein